MRKVTGDQRGLGLVETLVAVAILGTSVVAFAVSLATGSVSVREQDGITVARGLAQNQMEYTQSYPFDQGAVTYPALATPSEYSLSVGVSAVSGADAHLQKITVTVSREGSDVLTVESYKMDR